MPISETNNVKFSHYPVHQLGRPGTRLLSTEKMRAATTLMAARLNSHTMLLNNNGHQHVFFTMTEWVSHP
jgi:hypothetical protein